jgi:hypothetical protein
MREPELPGYVYIMAATNDAMVVASIDWRKNVVKRASKV